MKTARAAARASASASTIALSNPESSSVVGISRAAHTSAIARPTAVDPVNTTWSKCSSASTRRPSSRVALRAEIAPCIAASGSAAEIASSSSLAWVRGARSDGFTTTRLPASTACTSWMPMSWIG